MTNNHITITRSGDLVTSTGKLADRAHFSAGRTWDEVQRGLIEALQQAGQESQTPLQVLIDDQVAGAETHLRVAVDGAIEEQAPPQGSMEVGSPLEPTPSVAAEVEPLPRPASVTPLDEVAEARPKAPRERARRRGQDRIASIDDEVTVPPTELRLDFEQEAPSTPTRVERPWLPVAPPSSALAPAPTPALEQTPARPTREDLVRARPDEPTAPAAQGWRAALRRATFGAVSLAPSVAEQQHRDAIARVQRSLAGPKTIVVLNPKGGAHKTTATLMLAATFGVHRGGAVLAWDNNETQGTLASRGLGAHHGNTAIDLLRDIERFNQVHSSRFGDLDNYVRGQGPARFDILASDDDPTSPAIMSGQDFDALHAMLARFYRVLVVDTGNNPRASNWISAVDAADQLVLVTTLRDDAATVAAGLADRLHAHGLGAKLEQGVTILAAPDPREDAQIRHRLTGHFASLTRAVAEVPYEPAFVGGGLLNLETLRPATVEAWLQAAAAVADGLRA